jgi:hypothetical protein
MPSNFPASARVLCRAQCLAPKVDLTISPSRECPGCALRPSRLCRFFNMGIALCMLLCCCPWCVWAPSLPQVTKMHKKKAADQRKAEKAAAKLAAAEVCAHSYA